MTFNRLRDAALQAVLLPLLLPCVEYPAQVLRLLQPGGEIVRKNGSKPVLRCRRIPRHRIAVCVQSIGKQRRKLQPSFVAVRTAEGERNGIRERSLLQAEHFTVASYGRGRVVPVVFVEKQLRRTDGGKRLLVQRAEKLCNEPALQELLQPLPLLCKLCAAEAVERC